MTSLGEERVCLCAFNACVILHTFRFFPSSLPLGVGDWLRLVIVAFPDFSINFSTIKLLSLDLLFVLVFFHSL